MVNFDAVPENPPNNIELTLDTSHLPIGERVLVACSGGADSTALLVALQRADYQCIAAHINHGTRGEESDGDENAVAQLCAELQIPFTVRKFDFSHHAHEAELRDARYSALLDLAHTHSCRFIATGHTVNDNLETVLLNWLRGASVTGFAGIPPTRILGDDVLLVRPLIESSRDQVRQYLEAHDYQWREDSSNQSDQYLRNRVRLELLPLMAAMGSDENQLARQTLTASRILRDDLNFLEVSAQAALNDLVLVNEQNLLILDGLKFQGLPIAIQRRVLRNATQKVEENSRDMAFARIEEVREHITLNRRRAVWQWRKNLIVEWTGEHAGNRIRFKRV